MRDDFVVNTPEDILPGLKRLQAGETVTVVPSLRGLFEYEARKRRIPVAVEDDGFCYEFRATGG